MTLEELKNYYKNAYEFERCTGMSHNNWPNWDLKGYIPIISQIRIQKITSGVFKACLSDTTEGLN